MTGWTTWSPNGTGAAAFSETYYGGHSGAYHLTHWTNNTPFEAWTYQSRSGLAAGNQALSGRAGPPGSAYPSRAHLHAPD